MVATTFYEYVVEELFSDQGDNDAPPQWIARG